MAHPIRAKSLAVNLDRLHTIEAGPGDTVHSPAGPAHRHRSSVPGAETVRYVPTEFT